MAISEDKTTTLVIMPKVLKKDLEVEAKAERRSLSNYIVWVLENRKNANPFRGILEKGKN